MILRSRTKCLIKVGCVCVSVGFLELMSLLARPHCPPEKWFNFCAFTTTWPRPWLSWGMMRNLFSNNWETSFVPSLWNSWTSLNSDFLWLHERAPRNLLTWTHYNANNAPNNKTKSGKKPREVQYHEYLMAIKILWFCEKIAQRVRFLYVSF